MKCSFLTCRSFVFFAVGISGQAKAEIFFKPVTARTPMGGLLGSGANIFSDLPLTVR